MHYRNLIFCKIIQYFDKKIIGATGQLDIESPYHSLCFVSRYIVFRAVLA